MINTCTKDIKGESRDKQVERQIDNSARKQETLKRTAWATDASGPGFMTASFRKHLPRTAIDLGGPGGWEGVVDAPTPPPPSLFLLAEQDEMDG